MKEQREASGETCQEKEKKNMLIIVYFHIRRTSLGRRWTEPKFTVAGLNPPDRRATRIDPTKSLLSDERDAGMSLMMCSIKSN